MSGLETVTSSVEDVLIDSLQFKPAPGASYLTAKGTRAGMRAGATPTQATRVSE